MITGHNCRIKTKQTKKNNDNNKIEIENLQQGLNHAFQFFNNVSADDADDRYNL